METRRGGALRSSGHQITSHRNLPSYRQMKDISDLNTGPLVTARSKENTSRLSIHTIEQNKEQAKTNTVLRKVFGARAQSDIDKINKTDTGDMLQRIGKDLKRTDYRLSRIVTSGTDHFSKLKVTNQQEIKDYK